MNHSTPLVNILDAIAEEISDLGIELDELQTTLSPAMYEIAKNADYVRNVQTLDLMSQRLTAISAFVFSLNLSIPETCLVNSSSALSEVKLSALAQRLTGSEEQMPAYCDSGDVDLF
ncbi:hypothetical protein [Acidisoma sp.]|uniref:hypothetical protein n=1 Tax=Acidisoma sp. TaxID=1872115 RepID=UPI003B00A401